MKLHRCRTPWKFGPCWRVQKALDDQRIPYELVRGRWRPKNRAVLIEGTGQALYPAVQFESGGWYREESEDMAKTIRVWEASLGIYLTWKGFRPSPILSAEELAPRTA